MPNTYFGHLVLGTNVRFVSFFGQSDPKMKKLANTTADFGNFITKTKICNEPGNNQTDMMDPFFSRRTVLFS